MLVSGKMVKRKKKSFVKPLSAEPINEDVPNDNQISLSFESNKNLDK
jgi:hypothetical protein